MLGADSIPVPPTPRPKPKQAPPPSIVPRAMIDPEDDLRRLIDNENKLRVCGYYYGGLSWLNAARLLHGTPVGTFLIRDSEHPCYLFSLSVQTVRGPTSCRIDYHYGRFRLDSSSDLAEKMPRFELVTDLVDHYVRLCHSMVKRTDELLPIWLDMSEVNTNDLPVQIYRPRYRGVRTLQHMCRVGVVRTLLKDHPSIPLERSVEDKLSLPKCLKQYLLSYPHPQ